MNDPNEIRRVNAGVCSALQSRAPGTDRAREELRAALRAIPDDADNDMVFALRREALAEYERALRVDADQREWLAKQIEALPPKGSKS